MGHRGVDDRFGLPILRPRPAGATGLPEGGPQVTAVLRPIGGAFAGDAEPLPPAEVGAAPPAGDGRQVVRRGHRHRIGAPVGRGQEAAALAFEPHHRHP